MQVISCDPITSRGPGAPFFILLCALMPLWCFQTAAARALADTHADTLPRCGRSIAYDVNDAGWIVGSAEVSGEERLAVAWMGDSILRLGTLGGRSSEALAVDEEGRIVGTSRGEDHKDHGFLWEGGRMRDLAPIERGVGIDGPGRILGNRSSPAPAVQQAFLWVDGEVSSLGSLGVDEFVVADAMNAGGQAVGSAGVFGPNMERRIHPFLWEDGRMRDLTPDAVGYNGAGDISDAGHVVGALMRSDAEAHAFIWKDGRLQDLGTFGGRSASAVAVDDRGRFVVNVVVREGDPPREGRALLVDGDRVIDLGKLRDDDRKTEAHAMNNQGTVVGESGERAFVWEDGTMRKLPSPVSCREPDLGPPTGAPIEAKAPGDVDGDGVGDENDLCPLTPEGAIPDRFGCPMDSDNDGRMDGLDRCPDTARGAIVDRFGCPADRR
jgi:probable HAF family extracellular repeat protein